MTDTPRDPRPGPDTRARVIVTSAATATHMRGTHPYAFRSRQWARIVTFDHRLADGRPTVLVTFPDGVTDVWVLDDRTSGWEFIRAAQELGFPTVGTTDQDEPNAGPDQEDCS